MRTDINVKLIIALVIYKQKFTATIAYQTLLKAIEYAESHFSFEYELFIYDNSPSAADLMSEDKKIQYCYIHDATNPGVSKAYNEAWSRAQTLNYNWLLLLDQDTSIQKNGLFTYLNSIKTYPHMKIHAPVLRSGDIVVSPSLYKHGRGFPLKEVKTGINKLGTIVPLNSGMCVHRNVFEYTGGYNNKIKLDFSDFDFIRRASANVKEFVVMDLVNQHELSSQTETFNSAIVRFKFYCSGARNSVLSKADHLRLAVVAWLRGAKLSVKFRSLRFQGIFWSYFLRDKEI